MDKQSADPALWPLLDAFPPIDLSAEVLMGFRAALKDMSAMPDASTHADVRVEEIHVQAIRCLLYRPRKASPSALLHIHGGGYVMGSPEMDAARNIELVRTTGCTILSPDYRLAPEHPHPAGLEDCHTALAWLASQAGALEITTARIGVIGESAGGGLAAALALLARDRASVQLACQVLIYPMLIPPAQSVDAVSTNLRTGQLIWTRASNNYAWATFLSGEVADPATIAGLAPDVTGLPPAFLAVGELDLFVHDNMVYVTRLLAAGCSTEAHLYPRTFHGFDRMVDAAVSQRYTRELVAFLLRHLG